MRDDSNTALKPIYGARREEKSGFDIKSILIIWLKIKPRPYLATQRQEVYANLHIIDPTVT